MIINAPSSVIFVDSNIADYQSLVNSVEPETKVVVLDPNRNGVEQITEVLANYDNLDSVQILSHGDSAVLQLGNSSLDNGNIESYENQLQQWGKALSENGDILLYGCNVAEGEQGQAFINRLGEITAADIAASEDLTGNSDLGGDWVLEATTGFIESPLAFQVEAMSAFNSVLQTFTVTNNRNSGAGSLRQAILDSENNNNGGTIDIIQVDVGFINLADSLPTISEDVEIRGNGAVINGSNQHQIVAINGEDDDTQIILSDLSLTDGRVRGSSGVPNEGGGGGLGAGGALFINNGTVIANNVDFTGNRAVGGNGSTGARGGSAERTGEDGGRGGIANENGGTAFADTTRAEGGNGGSRGRRNGQNGGSGSDGEDGSFGNGGGSGGGGGGGESGGVLEGFGGFGGDGGDGGFGAGGGAGGGAGSNPSNRRRKRRTALGGEGGDGGAFGGDGEDGVDVPAGGSRGRAVRGGGGAALGGAIFVNRGADLILLNSNFSGNSTIEGNRFNSGNSGQAKGRDIFVREGVSIFGRTLIPGGQVSQANTNVATGNNLDNGSVFGDISNFILPTINIAPGDDLSEPDQNGSFNLSLNRALPVDLIVNYTITGTAINDPDLLDDEEIDSADVSIPLSVTIPAGDTTGSINAEVIDDRLFDPDENIIITLEDSPLYNLGTSISAELAIVDDEPDITLEAINAVEGESNGQFIFNLAPNAPEGRQLSFSITGGTAELDTDYRFLNTDDEPIFGNEAGSFFLDISGEEQVVVQLDATGITGGIPDFDDGVAEGNETVEITLNESEEYGGGGNTITANIIDNDSPPIIDVVAGDNATETDSNPGVFQLNFSNPLLSNGNENDDEDAIFNFTIGGNATRGEDYILVLVANNTEQDIIGNSFSLPEGTTTARIEVRPIDDNNEEVNENVTFTLNEGEGYELGEASAELTIVDSGGDDADNVVGVQISESQGSTNLIEGQTTDNYTIELTSQPTSDVTINFATDATQIESINPITFTPENFNIRQNVTVVSVDDNITTEDRTSVISHTATSDDAAYQGIAINEVTANITENDVPGIVIGNGNNFTVAEGELGQTYTIALATQPTADVTISFGISDDLEAIAPITFIPDNFATPQEVTITAAIDDLVEPTEFQNITHNLVSEDPVYNELEVQPLPIAINELSFDNIETAGGLNNALNSIQDSIDAQFRAIELPFIGSLETLAPDLIGSFQNTLINRVQTGGILDVEKLSGLVEETIEEILDVDVEAIATLSEEEATFDITVAKEFNLGDIDLDADLGLPGLGIDVDGSVDLDFNYQFDFGFGINQEFGFFIDTEKTNFTAGVDLGLSDDFQATGNLGFLQLDLVNDEENPTAVGADFTLGLNDIDNDENSNTGENSDEEEDIDGDRLTSTELSNASFDDLSDLFDPSASASANLGLKAVTSIQADTAFPSINFDLAGEFGSFTFEDGEAVGDFSPTIAFNDVQLDLGSFLSDFARPVIGNINSIIDPFRPIVDFLNTDTEILNDLSIADGLDDNGDGEISVIELAIGIAELTGNPPNANFQAAFNQITELFALSDALNESIAGDEGILIDVGSFELGNFDPSDPDADPTEVAAEQTESAPDLDRQLDDAPDGGSRNTQKANTNRILNNGNFDIPLINNPFSAIDLLLGKDVALFTYDLPALEVGFDVEQTFPIFGPISGLLEGDFNVALDLAFGFDTFGFNQWSANNFDPLESFKVLDGFFVSDRENPDGTGEDIDELVATATIAAGLGVNLVVLSGFLKGGLEGIIGLDLIDGGEINGTDDGRLRTSEIAERISTPFELFQLNGIVNAFLGAEVDLFGRTVFEQRIATFPLAEFSVGGKGNSFSSVIDGVISGGTVFFDANFNGIQDPNEPVTISNADGSYDLDIPFSPFDLNSNGVIDPKEGRVVIVNGIDISTSLPQTAPIITTPNATIATPLTSLISEIAKPDLDAAQAEVINVFGLSENSDLYNDDPKTSEVSVLGLQSQLQNLIILATQTIAATSFTGQTINGSDILTQDGLIYLDNNNNQQFDDGDLEVVQADDGSRVLMQSLMGETPKTALHRFFDINDNGELDNNEVSSTVNEAQIASAILQAIADRANNGEAPDLTDTDTITAIINEALTVAIAEDPNTNLNENAISQLTASIVEKNLNIDDILGKAFLSEAEQRQQITKQYVFIDVNDNGIQDRDEPSSLVDETGGDELDITPFDTNENGLLDMRVVVEGASPDYVFVDSNANGVFDPDEPFSVVNPSGENNLEIDFIDNNGNGVQDENEPFLIASPLNPDGTEVAISPFDLNENGVLEAGEDDNNNGILDPGEDNNENGILELDELGQVVLESPPIDRWSFVDSNGNGEFDRGELFSPVFDDGTDLLDPFVEPGKVFVDSTESPELAGGFQHLVTNPLATISRLLAEGTDPAVAQNRVKTALGIPEDVDLFNYDALQSASDDDPNWLEVYAKQVQVQNTLVQIEAVTGVDETEIIEALSNQIANSENLDLSDSTQVARIINELAPELADNTVDSAAEIITESNKRIDDIAIADDSTMDDREKSIEIVQVQQIAQSDEPEGTVEDLVELGTEEENVEEIVDDNTGEKLTAQIESTEEIDPTTRPDFSNSRPIAEPDFVTTDIATPVTIDVLANDSDPDNDPIEVVDFIALQNTDVDVDEDTGEIVDTFSSDSGEVVINPDNTLTYTPSDGFTGEDIIFYAIQDSNGNVDNNIVTVTVGPVEIIPEGNGNNNGDNNSDNNGDNDFINGGEGNDTELEPTVTPTPETLPEPTVTPTPETRPEPPEITGQTIAGSDRDDELMGTEDSDILSGDGGNDVIFGLEAQDYLSGDTGNDWSNGNQGDDFLEGGEGDDTVYGGKDNDTLIGDRGNDELWGDNGEDIVTGVNPETNNPGVGEIDTLQGGEGADTFVLGDDLQFYYNDNTTNPGLGDYALIVDFDAENDTIQLHGNRQDYRLGDQPDGLPFGASLYWINGEQEELVAMIQGTPFPNLEEDYFTFV
ncbi:hypothetical protein M595_1458 [Lyngbya aestuarii BL J]|uniref:DUF4347 domain-containing protein n=1 Tax=Lyngbya aestuarii BL J TaxID=1348334 RepID=U7QL29_9CYAN|nr:DUF4347 domain-containing protein [Lyngbya aestuarii]ERT08669.1 hypothetical protein M595_1458 [Lyngbya aestuarii BL J]